MHVKSNVLVETWDNDRNVARVAKRHTEKVPRAAELWSIGRTHAAETPTRARQWGLTRAGLHQ
jgi:hypothetical protein